MILQILPIWAYILVALTYGKQANGDLDFTIRGVLTSGRASVTMTCSDTEKTEYVYAVSFKRGNRDIAHMNIKNHNWVSPEYSERSDVEVHNLKPGNVKVSLTMSQLACEDEDDYECQVLKSPSTKVYRKYFRILSRPGPLTMTNINNTVPHTGVLLEIRCGGMVGNPPGNFMWYRQRREDSDWVRIHDRNNQTEPFLNTTTCQYYRNSTLYYLLSKSDIDLLIKCSVSNGVGEGYSVEVTGEFGVDELGVAEIAGIAVGCIIAAFILLVLCCCYQKKKKYVDDDSDDEEEKGRMEPDVESHQPHQSKRNDEVGDEVKEKLPLESPDTQNV